MIWQVTLTRRLYSLEKEYRNLVMPAAASVMWLALLGPTLESKRDESIYNL